MPGKKGSRVAARQARAQANAKKKARSAGPDLSTAARVAPAETPVDDADLEEATEESSVAIATNDTPVPTAPAPRPTRRTASRRERQAFGAISAGSLKREVATIGIIAASAGVALAVIKLATDLGR